MGPGSVSTQFATPVGKFYPRQNSTAKPVNPDFSLGNEYQKQRVASFFRMTRKKGKIRSISIERLASKSSAWNFSRKERKKATRFPTSLAYRKRHASDTLPTPLCFTVADVPALGVKRATAYGSDARFHVAPTKNSAHANTLPANIGPGSRQEFFAMNCSAKLLTGNSERAPRSARDDR